METLILISSPGKSGSLVVAVGVVDVGNLECFCDPVFDRGCCNIPGLIDGGTSASSFSDST